MPIEALPQDTIRALNSSQTLNDAASLVKELIDNGLDVKASSISVEISCNSLDIIQVRDNGFGINPADRGLLARRHCTSKIRDFGDIVKLGGTSLGFRGEALASAAELSESLIISTRIEGEPVAEKLKIGRHGGILSKDPVSHPVGTTVRISNFLHTIPVRKQTALKSSSKALSKIKSILQAYALAKPRVRYSLKILKAEDGRYDWTYPASKSLLPSLDAAVKIVGNPAVTQCEWKVWHSSIGFIDGDFRDAQANAFILEALLPTRQCDTAAINNVGQFVSIDSRPMARHKNNVKKMMSIFKSYIQNTIETNTKVVDPFMFLNISCPVGSYDINVEPGKDEVLFTDEDGIITICESFFKQIYGGLKSKTRDEGLQFTPKQRSDSLLNELTHNMTIVYEPNEKLFQTARARNNLPPPEHQTPSSSTMYNDGDPDYLYDDVVTGSQEDDYSHPKTNPDNTALDPWTIAKLNAPFNRPRPRPNHGEVQCNGQLLIPRKENYDATAIRTPPPRPNFPARKSFDPRGSPLSAPRNTSFPQFKSPKGNSQQTRQQSLSGTLDHWLAPLAPEAPATPVTPNLFTPINVPEARTPLSDIQYASQRPRKQYTKKAPIMAAQKPFVPPLKLQQPRMAPKVPPKASPVGEALGFAEISPSTPPKPPPLGKPLDFIKSSPREASSQLGPTRLHELPDFDPYSDPEGKVQEEGIASFGDRIRVPLLVLEATVHAMRRITRMLAQCDDYVYYGNIHMGGDLVDFSREFARVLE